MKRRVVITGIGMISPIACGAEQSWSRLIVGESGIRNIEKFDVSDLPSKIAGIVPTRAEQCPDFFDDNLYVSEQERRKMDEFIVYAIAASKQALEDAYWNLEKEADQERTGVVIGAGIGGLQKIYENSVTLFNEGARRVSPFFVPSALINLASGHVSIRHNLKGPNHAVSTACASGTHAIGEGTRLIMLGEADVMVAGGAEGAVCRLGVAGFSAARALSTNFNEEPTRASRPWDKSRDGFVIAEGAGIVILEEYEHAKKRGAKIYAEILGYGLSSDAYHMTAPPASGEGAYRAMKASLKNAELEPSAIGYVNAHGTSTVTGDIAEINALKKLFGKHAYEGLSISSTKSATGHLLGGAGAIEAIFLALALRDGIMPPTLNLDIPDEGCDLDLIPHKARRKKFEYAMSNSFGFGGTNASLIFGLVS